MKEKGDASLSDSEGLSSVYGLWQFLYFWVCVLLLFFNLKFTFSINEFLTNPYGPARFTKFWLWMPGTESFQLCIVAVCSAILCLRIRKLANFSKGAKITLHAILVLLFVLLLCLPLTAFLNDVISAEATTFGDLLTSLYNGTLGGLQNSSGGSHAVKSYDAISFVGRTSQLAIIVSQWLLIGAVLKAYVISPSMILRRNAKGLSVGLKFWQALTGFRHLSWNEIKRVSIDTSGNQKFLCLEATNEIFKIRWSDLKKTEDPTDLLNEIRTHVSDVSADDVASNQTPADTANQYTELWLKYFSASSKRTRTSSLTASESLCNGRYQIAGELGQGGQGTAYLASCAGQADASVVLKEYILPVHRGETILQQSISKLNREAEILKKIHHPNIVELKDTFIEDHRGYIVLEYVEGNVLKDLIKNIGPQPDSVVIDIAIQVCDALEYLHNMDPPVVHRDLTPDNLILQPDGNVKLVDFNVAQQLEPTATSTVVGKHAYIPPEQFRGKPSRQSDIFALGGTLHYLLTGKEPEPLSVSHPKSLAESTSSELDEIIAKATTLEQSKRFADAAEFRQALQSLKPKTINTKSEVSYEKR